MSSPNNITAPKIDGSLPPLPLNCIPLLLVSPYIGLAFARTFPFILWSRGAHMFYVSANYRYDEENTFFDNTVWTYGTDYTLAVIMTFGAVHTWNTEVRSEHARLRSFVTAMLVCYALSVFSGAIAHHNFLTVDDLNTTAFRTVWVVCVGTVTTAGAFIGAIGSEIGRALHGMNGRHNLPVLPHSFWCCWGLFQTAVCVAGGISYKRPACDIFIAGTTQSIPTFYCVLMLMSRYWETGTKADKNKPVISDFFATLQTKFTLFHRTLFLIGFLLNAPLLPAYPVLLSLNLSLGHVNFILHTNLCFAWGLQYITLRKLCAALKESGNDTKQD